MKIKIWLGGALLLLTAFLSSVITYSLSCGDYLEVLERLELQDSKIEKILHQPKEAQDTITLNINLLKIIANENTN